MTSCLLINRHRAYRALIPLVAVCICLLLFLSACTNDSVKEYFTSHGIDYPADVTGIALLGINLVGVDREELLQPGAKEFVGEGVLFMKEYFSRGPVTAFMPGVDGIIVTKPVLFRDESGEVGLMVTVTGFGTGSSDAYEKLGIEWVGEDRDFWKVKNFAYFNRNAAYKWKFGGWVF